MNIINVNELTGLFIFLILIRGLFILFIETSKNAHQWHD